MVDKVDMSLDDIIKQSGKGGGGGIGRKFRGRGRGAGRGLSRVAGGGVAAFRSRRNSGNIRASRAPYTRNSGDIDGRWRHDMYEGSGGGAFIGAGPRRGSGGGGGDAKLIVSNLEFGVSDSDIQELFSEFGPLKLASIHYERSGRSLGIADVVFDRRSDAIKAMNQYNGVPLDGRPMKIRLAEEGSPAVGQRLAGRVTRPLTRGFTARRGGRGTGGGRGGRGGRATRPNVTAEELDAELDAYVKQSK